MDVFPYTLLDYGLAAVAIVVMGFIVYTFTKFLSNHMSKVTQVLDDLVQTSRGMRDEFFRLNGEVRDLGNEVRNHRFEDARRWHTYKPGTKDRDEVPE